MQGTTFSAEYRLISSQPLWTAPYEGEMGDMVTSSCFWDDVKHADDEWWPKTGEKHSDATIVASGDTGLGGSNRLLRDVIGSARHVLIIEDAQGFLDCPRIGAFAGINRLDPVDGAYTVAKSGVSVHVSTFRSKSCSKGSLQESVYIVSRKHGRL